MNIDDRDRPSTSSGAGMTTNNGKYQAAENSQEPGPSTAFLSEQSKELGNLALTFDEQAMMKAISRMNFEDTEEMKPFPEVAAEEQSGGFMTKAKKRYRWVIISFSAHGLCFTCFLSFSIFIAANYFSYVDIDEGRCRLLFVSLPFTTMPIILVVPFVSTVHANIFMRNPIFFCTSFSVKVVYDGRAHPGIHSFDVVINRFNALNQSVPVCYITSKKFHNSVRVRSRCMVDIKPEGLAQNVRKIWAREGAEEIAMVAKLATDKSKKKALLSFEGNLQAYHKLQEESPETSLQLCSHEKKLRKILLLVARRYTELLPESLTPQVHALLDGKFIVLSH
ncbi:unnamed protein product [Gongylonema pulchrum]|uniref:PHB domain-containing protein n=1 Tax=Gongylonema pulchrum TaxID=637853 RepID=A0A183EPH6_9BILA|nr:unnamed protein product [Gongylonema pulchrum]